MNALLPIKGLSINAAYTGRRYKTKTCQRYVRDVLTVLPHSVIPDGPLSLYITWGFSSRGADIDNCAKVFIDCLQKKYDFNDNRIYKLTMLKVKVGKGEEFIKFVLESL